MNAAPKNQLWPKVVSRTGDARSENRSAPPVVISFNVSVRSGGGKESATTDQHRISMKPVRKKVICEDFPKPKTHEGQRSEKEAKMRARLAREIERGLEVEIANLRRKLEENKSCNGGPEDCDNINEASASASASSLIITQQAATKWSHTSPLSQSGAINNNKKKNNTRLHSYKKGKVGGVVNKLYVSGSGCWAHRSYTAMLFRARLFSYSKKCP